jgi:hypothetical protein
LLFCFFFVLCVKDSNFMVTLKILLKILKIENYKQVCDFETPN